MIHRNLLRYRGARYLWWSIGLLATSFVLYSTQGEVQPPNGGTWQGYVLGTIGAALIVWLTMLAIRKRSYHSTTGTVQGWASAHVYLGTALLVIATLHSGAQLGWNLHTLAYVLMCIVIVSGFFGLYSDINHPQLIAKNREGGGRSELFAELFELDKQTRALAQKCAASVTSAVDSSIERTTLGGGVYAQLFGSDNSFFIRGEGEPARNTDQQGVRIPRRAATFCYPRWASARSATAIDRRWTVSKCSVRAVTHIIRHPRSPATTCRRVRNMWASAVLDNVLSIVI